MNLYFGMRILLICLFVILASCSSSPKNKGKDATGTPLAKSYRPPEVPAIYTSPREQVRYLIASYWNEFDFANTSLIHRPDITEQAFADFLQMFPRVSRTDLEKGISSMLDKALAADSLVFALFTGLCEKYLYDPNSPLLNEEFYIPVLEYIVKSPEIGEIDKMRPAYRLEMALKNRVGSTAADFTYTLASGKKSRLSEIPSDYTIVLFNNPDCSACREIRAQMNASAFMKSLLNTPHGRYRKAVLLSVFPDPELDVWRKYLPEQPREWRSAYDDGQIITKERLYDLRAIPTFYLLDKDKKVILKDVPFGVIVSYLNQHI